MELSTLSGAFHGVALYSSLYLVSHSFLSIIVMWHVVSNLCCALSVLWFTLQTIHSKVVMYAVILSLFYELALYDIFN